MYQALIVDDEYVIREGLAEGINWHDLGFVKPAVAANGQEALAIIEKETVDLVVTDVKMPVMDGIELCGHIRRRYPDIMTIILSGFSDFEFARKAIDYKVCAYLLKPLREEQLINLIIGIRQELDNSSKKRQQNEENITTAIKPDLLLQSFMIKLLNGNTNDMDRDEGALEQLGIRLHQAVFQVIVMADDSISGRTIPDCLNSQVLDCAATYWKPYPAVLLTLSQMLIIVLYEQHRISLNTLLYRLKAFQDYLAMIHPALDPVPTFSYGISSASSNPKTLQLLLDEAKQALHERFFKGQGQIITFEEMDQRPDNCITASILDQHANAIADKLLRHSRSDVLQRVRLLFDDLLTFRTPDTNLLNIHCIQAYSAIIRKIKIDYIYLPVPTVEELYSRISACQTFHALSDEFNSILQELSAQIKTYTLSSDRHQFIARLKQYIRENYHARLSLDQLAQTFFINSSYLSKIFKDETEEKLSDYIMNVRLDNAKHLLKTSTARIQDIAAQVGYDDYRHFCTVFKKATGLTPLQYRIKSV